ncbi:hypothetical protein [Bordetella genomosp. 13]|uniref:hypothetical protein n=1 Tax=Bordetella genomosp. 13 TaxID=463040 RepID=UPI0011A30565|nr:hypothetical protein [Bordetella genomosp. 13]
MNDILSRFVRAALFAVLGLIGMAMALVFMISTAVAVGILYVVAKVRGKPFGARAYWSQRRAAPGPFPGGPAPFAQPAGGDIIDVEAREIR